MYEFHIYHFITGERYIIFGYNLQNACLRSGLNPKDWIVDIVEYVD